MALVRRDEVLEKALSTDETAIPRFNIIGADGSVLYRNARLELANRVVTPGTPINKVALDEILAASGVTGGTSTAYTLAQENFALSDGAEVRFRLHTPTGSGATLNVNGTGAKPLRDAMGNGVANGIPAGTWLSAMYSAATGAYTLSGGAGGGSNENLADNWYLGDPVNSRGRTEYNFTNSYTIDRWKGLNKGVLTIGNEELTLISVSGYPGYIRQFLADNISKMLVGQKITFSALVKGYGRAHLFSEPGVGGYGTYKQYDDWDVITMIYTVPADCTRIYFGLNVPDDGTSAMQIKAVKLELGSTQTLARKDATGAWVLNDPPPDKGMELLKCIQSTADPADTYANKIIATTDQAKLIAADQSKVISTTHITTAAKQIDIPVPSGYTRYRLIAAGLSVDYSQDDSLDTGVFNLIAKATAQTVSSREYAWEIGGFTQVITSPDVTDHTNGRIGSVPASRSANSAYMQMEIFKSGDNWAGTLNGNGSSYDGTAEPPSGFCYATFTSSEISTLSLVCTDNITAGMILLEGLA